jgi:hypothetical protein
MAGNKTTFAIFGIFIMFNVVLIFYNKQNCVVNRVYPSAPSSPPNRTISVFQLVTKQTGGYVCGNIQCDPFNITHGHCFLGKWFCEYGWTGEECDITIPIQPCESEIHDICYYHPVNGIAVVPMKRWSIANKLEAATWKGHGGTNDRAEERTLKSQFLKKI